MFALAGSAAAAVPIIATRLFIYRLIFRIDNQTAIRAIVDTSDHRAQTVSILFRRHTTPLLIAHPHLAVTIK